MCANMCEYEKNSGCRGELWLSDAVSRTLSDSCQRSELGQLSDRLSVCRTVGGLSDYCRTLSDTVETLSDKIGKIDIDKRANINQMKINID